MVPLIFQGESLRFQRSNRPGQPDALKLRTLQEEEDGLSANLSGKVSTTQYAYAARATLPFATLVTGVWEYDHRARLIFDLKYKDLRQGHVTFGRKALVLYASSQ